MADLVMAATSWHTNADMIEDVVQLGYIRPGDHVLDPTYGRGTWWKKYRPEHLAIHDITLDRVDFRNMTEPDNTFDVVAYDPPYIAVGGRKKSTIPEFNDRYGLHSTPRRPEPLQDYINEGIVEMHRVLKPRGLLLVKCCDYVNARKLWIGSHHTLAFALSIGFTLHDRLYHLRRPGPQSQTTQEHARQNLSTLLILKKSRGPQNLGAPR